MEEKSSNYDNKAELELLKKKIENWDIDTVSFWLKMNCFPELINTFKEEEITGISLLELKEADLKDLGITKIGKKKTFLKLLNDLKQMQSSEERKRKLPKLEASEIEIRKDSPMLGEGEFGFIFQAIYRKASVVIKELKDKSNQTAFFREGEIAYSLKHPSIIECFGYAVLNDTFYLLLEYAKHGPLNKYLEFHKDQILINQLIEFSLQVAKGMEFIEKNSIVHRGNVQIKYKRFKFF